MHPNPIFRQKENAAHLAFARARAFGALVTGVPDLHISHVPFVLNDAGTCADIHLVRSNPIARLGPCDATLAVTGPDGYVSPDWYEVPDQVPTWNYVAVHLSGRLVPLDPADLRPMLDRQSAFFESRLDKTPWTTAKMTEDALTRMMRQILPFRFEVTDVQGTWKLNQNKPDEVRLRAATQIDTGLGSDLAQLAAMMRDAGDR